MKSVYTGSEKVAEFESYDELRVGENKPAFIYEGNELVYPNPVKDGLVLWYDFSGRTNTDGQRGIAEDLSGNGNHGTLQNFNFTEESGYVEDGLKFDGVDDRVLMVSPGEESKAFLSSEMTIVWSGVIRETQAKSGINQILSAGYVNGWALGYHGQVDRLMYTVRDSNASTGYYIRYIDRPPFGEFFTFAMTFKNGEVTAYLNGIEKNKAVDTGDIIYSTYPAVEITSSIHQTTESCKIYNRPLTPEEIAHNYAIEKERFGIE